jgi:hypothetical protein
MSKLKSFHDFQNEKEVANESHSRNVNNYMFFQNLHLIKNAIDSLLFADSYEMDKILDDGHDWANDHISTAKESILQVADFFKTNLAHDQDEIEHDEVEHGEIEESEEK